MNSGNIESIGSNAYGNVQPDLSVPGNPGNVGEVGNAGAPQVDRQVPDAIGPEDLARMRAQPGIDGRAAMKGAKVGNLSEELRAMVPARHRIGKSIGNFFRFFARNIAKACHAIRNGLASAPSKVSRAQFQAKLERRHVNVYQDGDSRVGTLPNGQGTGTAFTCTTEELGLAMGLRKNITAKPFTADQVETIRKGQFKLTDITQDPNFEDCWFLSSLGAFLTAKGPEALQELITLPSPDEMSKADPSNPPKALVKLGGETYAVPLAELRDSRGSGVSADSAPWVKLMETAMQMHLVNLHVKEVAYKGAPVKVSMGFGDIRLGLASLLGEAAKEVTDKKHVKHLEFEPRRIDVLLTPGNDAQEMSARIESIQKALDNHFPVVIGSSDSYLTALGAGASPNHGLVVQDVVFKKDGTAYFLVLDPYNRSVSISSDILKDGGTYVYLERVLVENNNG